VARGVKDDVSLFRTFCVYYGSDYGEHLYATR
jgi:hypothetical protein